MLAVSVASGKDVASSMKILSSGKDVGTSLKILSYNVWFREDLELQKRMKAIGDLVHLHSPDLICFQVSLLSLLYLCSLYSIFLFDF